MFLFFAQNLPVVVAKKQKNKNVFVFFVFGRLQKPKTDLRFCFSKTILKNGRELIPFLLGIFLHQFHIKNWNTFLGYILIDMGFSRDFLLRSPPPAATYKIDSVFCFCFLFATTGKIWTVFKNKKYFLFLFLTTTTGAFWKTKTKNVQFLGVFDFCFCVATTVSLKT